MEKFNLFIDVSSTVSILTILDENNQIIEQSIKETNKNLVDLVNPQLEELLIKHQLKFENLKKIYLIIGPGSFTGVRVGVNISKTIKSVYPEVDLYIMNSLEAMCLGNGFASLDAKGKKVYVAAYNDFVVLLQPKMIPNEELNETLEKYQNLRYYPDFEINEIKRAEFAYKILDKFTKVEDWINLEPFYLKDAL